MWRRRRQSVDECRQLPANNPADRLSFSLSCLVCAVSSDFSCWMKTITKTKKNSLLKMRRKMMQIYSHIIFRMRLDIISEREEMNNECVYYNCTTLQSSITHSIGLCWRPVHISSTVCLPNIIENVRKYASRN